MPIERRRKLSEARMAKRSFYRVSGGHGCPERTSGEMAWARPDAWETTSGKKHRPISLLVHSW